MTRKERIFKQRVLAREAMGKLQAIEELFGAEDDDDGRMYDEHLTFSEKLSEFHQWLVEESPLNH